MHKEPKEVPQTVSGKSAQKWEGCAGYDGRGEGTSGPQRVNIDFSGAHQYPTPLPGLDSPTWVHTDLCISSFSPRRPPEAEASPWNTTHTTWLLLHHCTGDWVGLLKYQVLGSNNERGKFAFIPLLGFSKVHG